jgi:hypothetical protein
MNDRVPSRGPRPGAPVQPPAPPGPARSDRRSVPKTRREILGRDRPARTSVNVPPAADSGRSSPLHRHPRGVPAVGRIGRWPPQPPGHALCGRPETAACGRDSRHGMGISGRCQCDLMRSRCTLVVDSKQATDCGQTACARKALGGRAPGFSGCPQTVARGNAGSA